MNKAPITPGNPNILKQNLNTRSAFVPPPAALKLGAAQPAPGPPDPGLGGATSPAPPAQPDRRPLPDLYYFFPIRAGRGQPARPDHPGVCRPPRQLLIFMSGCQIFAT